MSLIQEALKRQQMEKEGKLPPPPGAAAKTEPPLTSTVVDGETFILPGVLPESAAPEEPAAPAKPALKRNARPAPEPPAPTPVPTPVPPPAPLAEEPERKRVSPTPAGEDSSDEKKTRVLPALAAMIILLLLLASAVVWAITYGLEMAGIRMPWSKARPVVAEQPVAEQPTAEPAGAEGTSEVKVAEKPAEKPADDKAGDAVIKPAKKTTLGSVVRQTVKDANTAVGDANVVIADAVGEKPAESKAPVKAVPVAEPKSAAPATVAETPALTAVAAPEVVPPPVSIKWPDLTISGVVGKEQKGAVFVNDKVIGVNETVEGIRVVAIKPQGALLEYQGETRLAKVGQPLNRATR